MLKNSFFNLFGATVRVAVSLLTIPLLIRMIGVDGYGLWSLASAVIGIVTLAEAGLSVSTTAFMSRDLGTGDSAAMSQTLVLTLGGMLFVATLAAGILWGGAEPLLQLFPSLSATQAVLAEQVLKLSAIVVWTKLIQQVLMGVEQAYQRYDLMNVLNTSLAIVTNVGIVFVAWKGGQIPAMMGWQAITSLVLLAAHAGVMWYLLKGRLARPRWDKKRTIEIGKFSAMTWVTSVGGVLFTQFDRIIVGALLGPAILGVYAAITNVTTQINFFSALPVQPLLPAISVGIAQQDTTSDSLRKLVRQGFAFNSVVALGAGLVLLILSPLIMHILLGDTLSKETILAFRICTVAYTLYSLNAVGYYLLFATNSVGRLLIVNSIGGVSALCLIALGSTRFGLLGACAGNLGYSITLLFVPLGIMQLRKSLDL